MATSATTRVDGLPFTSPRIAQKYLTRDFDRLSRARPSAAWLEEPVRLGWPTGSVSLGVGGRPDRSDGRPGPDHPAEPLHVAQQAVAVLCVLLERDIEEDLIDARVVHLLHVLRDLLPGAMGNGAGGVVQRFVGPID